MKKLLFILSVGLLMHTSVQAQGSEEYGSGLKVKLNEDGSRYVRFIIWNQIWTRAIENNPGTLSNGTPEDWTYDIGIRRARMLAYAQISPRHLILTHFGINNQTFVNGGVPNGGITGNGNGSTTGKKPHLFFHDVWNEYAVVPSKNLKTGVSRNSSLYIGTGLHYWHGISRMSSASTLNFLTVDAPIFNWPTIELSDQFARFFGIYAKGKLFKRLDYRLNISKPFALANPLPSTGNTRTLDKVVENNNGNSWLKAGYINYQFFDIESNLLPYHVGTYVGTKKVLNIGMGFQNQPNGSQAWQINTTGDTAAQSYDVNLFGFDLFADIPFGGAKNMALTAYSVLYLHNWGPNYLRNVGIMNVGISDPNFTGQRVDEGAGNARVLLGTGQIFYTQLGLLLPKKLLPNNDRLQPFAAYTYKNLEALQSSVNNYDLGINYYLSGHHAKITLQYSARPQIVAGSQTNEFKSEFIVQTQLYF